jgi:hypothetical protein
MSKSVDISVKLDLQYVKWNESNNNTTAKGQAQWMVDPTLTIIPQDGNVTLTWTLHSTNDGGASVRFSGQADEAAGIVWKNSTSNPGALTRVHDTKYQLPGYNNANPQSPTGWGYTINLVVTKGNFTVTLSALAPVALEYDPTFAHTEFHACRTRDGDSPH